MVSPENKIALDHELTSLAGYLVQERGSRNKKSWRRGEESVHVMQHY